MTLRYRVAVGALVTACLALGGPAAAQDVNETDLWLQDTESAPPDFESDPAFAPNESDLADLAEDPLFDQDFEDLEATVTGDSKDEAKGDDAATPPANPPDASQDTPAPGVVLVLAGAAAVAGLTRRRRST